MSTANTNGILGTGRFSFADPANIVRRPGWNTRFDFGDLTDIEGPMREHGFHKHQPLLVRRNAEKQFEIIDGDRRFTVVEKLLAEGVKFPEGIPVVIEQHLTDMDAMVHMLTSNRGKPFLPLEEAAAYKRMLELPLPSGKKPTREQLSKMVGRSVVHIYNMLQLLEAAPEVQEAVKKGDISSSLAKRISVRAKGDKQKQKELVEQAKGDKKGAKKAVEKIVKKTDRKIVKQRPLDADDLAEELDKLEKLLLAAVKELGTDHPRLVAAIKKDGNMTAAYLLGGMDGMSKAAGRKVTFAI